MKKPIKIILWSIASLFLVAVIAVLYVFFGGVSNPGNRKSIGEIRPPAGYERVEVNPDSFGGFIREFPLQKRGSHMHYFDGSLAFMQYWGYAVLDLPMISNNEQCADAIMRMHSEYLWSKGVPGQIHFLNCNGQDVRYRGGKNDRKALEKYLCRVYEVSNTASLRNQLKEKSWKDIAPGDVLVHAASPGHRYGHAVLIADVAINRRTGKKAIMIAQSSTPALTMHILRDFFHPILSPWLIIDDNTQRIFISGVSFKDSDLRAW